MAESKLYRRGRNFLIGTYALAALAIGYGHFSGNFAKRAEQREEHDAKLEQMVRDMNTNFHDVDLYAMEEKQ